MANETFKANDPFGVLGQAPTEADPWAALQEEAVNEANPWAAIDKQQAQIDGGADGGMSQFQTTSDHGFFAAPMGEFEATEADWMDQIKLAAGMMFTFEEQDQIDLIKNTLPEAKISMDSGGNAIVSYKGETGFVNEPGVSFRDLASVAGVMLGFTPAFRAAKFASTTAGKAALVGVANTITDAAMQGTVQALGGEKGVDAERALVAGLIGGASIPVVNSVIKIAQPLLKAHGVKKAKKLVEELGVRIRKHESNRLNPTRAYEEALKDMRMTTVEGEVAVHKAGVPLKKATFEQEVAFDGKLINKLKKRVKDNKLLQNGLEKVSDTLVPVSTRIEKMWPKGAGALRRMLHGVHEELIQTEKRVDGFLKGIQSMRKASPEQLAVLKTALVNGDTNGINIAISGSKNASVKLGYEDARIVLDEFQDLLNAQGVKASIKDFFPRIIRNYDDFLTDLTGVEHGRVTKAVLRAEEKALNAGKELDDISRSDIVNEVLRKLGKGYNDATRTTTKRTIRNVEEKLMKHYLDPDESLKVYLNNMINKKHKQAFSSKFTTKPVGELTDEVVDKMLKKDPYNMELRASISKARAEQGAAQVPLEQNSGRTVKDMLAEAHIKGEIKGTDEQQLSKLLEAVLDNGKVQTSGLVQDTKNVFYMSTLGNHLSAITQFGDIAVSGVLNGFTNTVRAVATSVAKKGVSVEDVAIAYNRAAEEMVSNERATARALNGLLGSKFFSGFTFVDRLGKRTFINAAHLRLKKQVKTGKGISDFKDKYRDSFTQEELHQTIESLKAGRVDDNVKFTLWNELSDAQPLTMLEMPKHYLTHPNGRIFYMLKTFTIKQMDIMRRTALDDIAAGRIGKGSKQLAIHVGALTAAGMSVDGIKDAIRGRKTDWDDKVVSSFWRNFGTSQHMLEKIKGGNITGAAGQLILPPFSIVDTGVKDMINLGKSFNSTRGDNTSPTWDTLKNVPTVGRLTYDWFGGGAEEFNDKQDKRQRKERFER